MFGLPPFGCLGAVLTRRLATLLLAEDGAALLWEFRRGLHAEAGAALLAEDGAALLFEAISPSVMENIG
jgi:hypothetical protein